MNEETIKSIIYLEDRAKKQDRDILTLRNSLSEAHAEVGAQVTIIKSLEKINERLLNTIEKRDDK